MKLFIYISIIVALSGLGSCGNNKSAEQEEEPSTEEHGGHEEDPEIAELTEAQMKSIGIELGTIEEKQLTSSLKTNGVLRVPNQNKASVNSLYSGVIRSLLVQPGNHVRKGQAIATVANPQFIEVQSELVNINSKLQLAELEVNRQRELNQGNAGALKNLQSAESELRSLKTLKSTLTQQVSLMGINPAKLANGKLVSVLTINSPINGVISDVPVKMGSYVDVSTVVAEIVDNSSLHLDLFVYEKDLPKLKNNQTIHFTITNNAGREYDAKIFSLGSSFEGESKAVTVHAMVEGDKSGLIDGMNVTAVISLSLANVPAVPSDAIVNVEGQDYIFVLKDSMVATDQHSADTNTGKNEKEHILRFERVAVAKAGSDIGYTEITTLRPIPAHARIVTRGAFFVSAKMTNTEGHSH
ncbi:MAG: efflux RND transporter periplasmic adaptor subunit [Chitinophagaceae bacterium]